MELIDKQDLTQRWRKLCEGDCSDCQYYDGISDICVVIENSTVVDPADHGSWRAYRPDARGYTDRFQCSVCMDTIWTPYFSRDCDDYVYCPMCGAKMDLEDDE